MSDLTEATRKLAEEIYEALRFVDDRELAVEAIQQILLGSELVGN